MPLGTPQNFSLLISAARGGKAAGDEFQNFMSFSIACFEERHGQGRSKRERLGVFLGYFLSRDKK